MHPSLTGFTAYRQFIVYKLVPSAKPGKMDKLPCDHRTGKVVSAHDPQYWTDAATAEATATAWGLEVWGVGFVFTESDPFWFVDIDACLVGGAWSPLAIELLTLFTGCAVEVSASLASLHIFGSGKPPVHRSKNVPLGLEFYSSGRFVALTGHSAMGNCLADASNILPAFVAKYFAPDTSTISDVGWTSGPVAEWNGPKDDAALLMKAMRPSPTSAFTGKAGFADLWTGNEPALAKSYPDKSGEGKPYDASSADAALAQHLAFWTGKDCDRIERLMRQSALVRDKWDTHTTYLREFTIQGAVDRQEAVYGDKVPVVTPSAPGVILGPSLTVPSGAPDEYAPEDFWAELSSHRYINRHTRASWSVDAVNGHLKRYTDTLGMKPAAWLDQFRAVSQMNWQPGYPELIVGMVEDQGTLIPNPKGKIYNLYRETTAVATEGEITRWLQHMQYLYPTDWQYILNWMAYRVQNPGDKINHALVVGGIPRTGKDMILTPLKYGVGESNLKTISPQKIFKDFNDWVECTLLVVNEAKDLGDVDRYTFENTIKQYIAAPPSTLTCNKKNLHPYQVPNVMSVVITTNFKLDGLFIPPDDGRYYVAWSDSPRINQDGYYEGFWEWLENGGGKQACYGYLMKLDVSGFRPKDNPPRTEAWHQIVSAGRNPEETMMSDVLEGLKIATVREIMVKLQMSNQHDLLNALTKGGRRIPSILSRVGMDALPNPNTTDGRWRLDDGRKDTLYVAKGLTRNEALELALRKIGDKKP